MPVGKRPGFSANEVLDALETLPTVRDATIIYVDGLPSLLTVKMKRDGSPKAVIKTLVNKGRVSVTPVSRADISLSDR